MPFLKRCGPDWVRRAARSDARRRYLVTMPLLFLAALALSAGIAWAAALYSRHPPMMDNQAPVGFLCSHGGHDWFLEYSRTYCAQVTSSVRLPAGSINMPARIVIEHPTVPGSIMYWDLSPARRVEVREAAPARPPDDDTLRVGEGILTAKYGWPLPCLAAQWRGALDDMGMRRGGSVLHGWRVREPKRYSRTLADGATCHYLGAMTDGVVPLSPLWGPLVCNALAYLTGVGVLVYVARTARRYVRARRGLCVHCAYSLAGIPVGRCPECGKE